MGCKPILPPDLKAKRSLILRRCDDQILNQKEEDIKSEIEKQNDCRKVQEIFKYNSSKNIRVTFESQHMSSQVLTKGLLLFYLSHPARNICKEICVKIIICFKCYQLEDYPTSSCQSQRIIKYAHRAQIAINIAAATRPPIPFTSCSFIFASACT